MYKFFSPMAGMVLIGLIFLGGCDDDSPEPPTPPESHLSVTPSTLDFGDSLTTLNIMITNEGTGSLEWYVNTKPAWCTVDPDTGKTTTETDTMAVTIVGDSVLSLRPGANSSTLFIESNDGEATITLKVLVSVVEGEWRSTGGLTHVILFVSQTGGEASVDTAILNLRIPTNPPECDVDGLVQVVLRDSIFMQDDNDTLFMWTGTPDTLADTLLAAFRGWFTSAIRAKGDLQARIKGCKLDTLTWEAKQFSP